MKIRSIKKTITFIIILILLYSIINFLKNLKGIEPQKWLDFSGNILGSILGVLGAYLILRIQIGKEKAKAESKALEEERPYFFIDGSGEREMNFEFYNSKHSLLNNIEIYFYVGGEKEEKHFIYNSIGHIKSDTKYRLEYTGGEIKGVGQKEMSPNNGVIIKGTTLLGEKISFIYGSFGKDHGISKTFYYDVIDKKKTGIYSGDKINDETFDDLISNIVAEKIKSNAIKVKLYLVNDKY